MISSILSFPLAFALLFGGSLPAKKHDPRIAPLAAHPVGKLPAKGKGSSGLLKGLKGKGTKKGSKAKSPKTAKTVKAGTTKKTIRHGR